MEIVHKHYELKYDSDKNRVSFKVKGLVPSKAAIPDFEKDWMKIAANVKPNWTILANLKEMKPFPPEVAQWNQEVQGKLVQRGLKKVGQVAPMEVCVQVNKMANQSGMKDSMHAFFNESDALHWLDQ